MATEVSAQFVNLSDKAEMKLVEAVASVLPSGQVEFMQACNTLIAEANAPGLIRKLLEQREAILGMENNDDVEGCFGIVFSLINKTDDPEKTVPALAEEVTDKVLDSQDKSAMRLKLAANLYNMLPARSTAQMEVLLRIIKYARLTKLLSMLASLFDGLDSFIEGWDLDVEDRRRLYLLVAETLTEGGKDDLGQKFLMRYLETFDNASQEELNKVCPVAVRGAVGAVKAPIVSFTEQHNLLGMPAVAQLKDNPKYTLVYKLLHIFSVEKLDAYIAFHKAHAATLAEHKIDHDSCMASMRLLSLCSLASEHEEIPYQVVRDTLQLESDDEAEDWVLQATGAGLMEAKMDQTQRVVVISRCTTRVFGPQQWKSLQSKLHAWQHNVQTLLATIHKSRERYGAPGAGAVAAAADATAGGGAGGGQGRPPARHDYGDN